MTGPAWTEDPRFAKACTCCDHSVPHWLWMDRMDRQRVRDLIAVARRAQMVFEDEPTWLNRQAVLTAVAGVAAVDRPRIAEKVANMRRLGIAELPPDLLAQIEDEWARPRTPAFPPPAEPEPMPEAEAEELRVRVRPLCSRRGGRNNGRCPLHGRRRAVLGLAAQRGGHVLRLRRLPARGGLWRVVLREGAGWRGGGAVSVKTPKVGQWVTVDGHEAEGAAKVEYVGAIAGVRLDRQLAGFFWWSPEELTAVSRAQAQALNGQKVTP